MVIITLMCHGQKGISSCEAADPDGTWNDLVNPYSCEGPPEVLITSQQALWYDVWERHGNLRKLFWKKAILRPGSDAW